MNKELTQDEIISGIKSGSMEVHKYVYELYRDKAIAKIGKMNASLSSLDIYQESMLALFKKVKSSAEVFDVPLQQYFMGIVHNQVLLVLNSKHFQSSLATISIDVCEIAYGDDDLNINELKDIVEDIVVNMDDKCKTCILLKYYEKKSYSYIAKKLNLSMNTIKSDMYQCRKKLRKLVEADPRVKDLIK